MVRGGPFVSVEGGGSMVVLNSMPPQRLYMGQMGQLASSYDVS